MREDIHPGKRADGEGAQGNKSGEVFNEVEHRGLPCFCVCSYMFDLCSRPDRNSGETGDTGKLVRNWLGEVPGALRFGTCKSAALPTLDSRLTRQRTANGPESRTFKDRATGRSSRHRLA